MDRFLHEMMKNVDQAEIFHMNSNHCSVSYNNNKLKDISKSDSEGLGIRIIKNNKLAQGATSNMLNLNNFAQKLIKASEYGETVNFNLPQAPVSLQKITLFDPAVNQIKVEDLVARGQKVIDDILNYDPNLLAFAGFAVGLEKNRIMNSNDIDHSYKISSFDFGLGAQLVEENNILFVHRVYMGNSPWTEEDIETRLEACLKDLSVARKNVTGPTGPTPVIFTPNAMADILCTLEEGINGANAAKGASPLLGKTGQKIFSEKLTILDDALNPYGTQSAPIDDEGVPCRTTEIVKDGVFKNFVLDLKNSSLLNMEPTGNGFRRKSLIKSHEYAAPVAPCPSNIMIAPGNTPLKDLIADIKNGYIIDQITGILLGNLLNGDFSGNINLGLVIKDGKPAGRIKNAMVAGNFYTIFSQKLIELSSDTYWTGNFGGGAGSYNLPWTYFKDIRISV